MYMLSLGWDSESFFTSWGRKIIIFTGISLSWCHGPREVNSVLYPIFVVEVFVAVEIIWLILYILKVVDRIWEILNAGIL